ERSLHVICTCKESKALRQKHFGQDLWKSSRILKFPLNKLVAPIGNTKLLEGCESSSGESTKTFRLKYLDLWDLTPKA
ncbi:hypothetical protein Trydic_g10278, partial [Trypoxylus dichotomus]